MNKRVLLIPLLTLFVGMSADATFWTVEPVYSGGFGAGDASITLNSLGIPSVSFTANSGLYVATKVLDGWATEFVAQVGYWGGWSSIACDSAGRLSVAFADTSGLTAYLKYAVKSSGAWAIEIVDDMGWLPDYVSLATMPSGEPCIAYCKTVGDYPNTSQYVCFARRIGTNNWVKQTIASAGNVCGPSLAIAPDGTRHVAFTDTASGELKVAISNGSSWLVSRIDGTIENPCVGYTSVCLQPNNKPAVAYFQDLSTDLRLKYARMTAAGWLTETARILEREGPCQCAIALTSGGIPIIGYSDPGTNVFVDTWKSGGRWLTETIDESTNSGFSPRFCISGLGEVYAVYFDKDRWNVYFARAFVPRSIAEIKSIPNGSTVQISGVVAASGRGELQNLLYVQEADRSCGVQLRFSADIPLVTRGMVLDVQGEITSVSGERAIVDPALVCIGNGTPPKPVSMCTRNVGGGTMGLQQGVLGSSGLNNIGLLVQTWGRVVSSESPVFKIDDGFGPGVRCYAPGISLPDVGTYVLITGISSCEQGDQGLNSLIRVRNINDIRN